MLDTAETGEGVVRVTPPRLTILAPDTAPSDPGLFSGLTMVSWAAGTIRRGVDCTGLATISLPPVVMLMAWVLPLAVRLRAVFPLVDILRAVLPLVRI